ncbi:hypothetical protein Sjap_025685 [Stephania japonica]|uniref:Uncharacterized protein n=1 Tax=Stephania japonica TaxID=461633 RepID=A0AAP0HFV3_9MAGN
MDMHPIMTSIYLFINVYAHKSICLSCVDRSHFAMEKPLLGGGSSSSSSSRTFERPIRERDASKPYKRRSDAITYGDRYQKAAALVDLVRVSSLFFVFLLWMQS